LFESHQLTTAASDTICGKVRVEHEAREVGVTSYHSVNWVFSSQEFCAHCQALNQKLTFSGVGAHHQNGMAEHAIQMVTNMAHANMIHASLHWPKRSLIDLLPMANAIWVYNKIPHNGAGLCPDELCSCMKHHASHLQWCHVFGCPVYVLDPNFQDRKNFPKWDSRARQGIFVGFSTQHSTTVPLILNPRTQLISPQYHVIFDDTFSTVPSVTSIADHDKRFEEWFHSSLEQYVDPAEFSDSQEVLDDHWVSPHELEVRQHAQDDSLACQTPSLGASVPVSSQTPIPLLLPPSSVPMVPEGAAAPLSPSAPHVASEGDVAPPLPSISPVSIVSGPPSLSSDDFEIPFIDQDTNVSPPYSLHPPGHTWKDGPA
jgi:hypothetical protein